MLNSRFNEENTKKRYVKEYDKFPEFLIGVDFDNTIMYLDGTPCKDIVNLLQELSRLPKITLCLWSICLSEENLKEKLDFCKKNDIRISYVNESPFKCGENRKAYFNALLDDRAGLESTYNCLYHLLVYIKNKLAK